MPIDVLLADDHAVLRAGIRALLEGDPAAGIRVVGEAGTGDEAVNLTQRLRPDVVVMDLSMPGSGGLEATRRITALGLDTKVLVLTMHAEEEYLIPVLEAGASGYLNKTTADRELVGAIGTVARGEVHLPPQATKLLLKEYREQADPVTEALHKLSSRVQEVLALTAEWYSSKEIGEKLFISPKTVDTYRERIMQKLGLRHRYELVRYALRKGMLKAE